VWQSTFDEAFDLSLTLRNLGERSNATRCEVLDPAARLGDGEEDGVACLWLERRCRPACSRPP
jgi:hypothetical protein